MTEGELRCVIHIDNIDIYIQHKGNTRGEKPT